MCSIAAAWSMDHPGDSIVSVHTNVLPVIDGSGNDECWNDATWVNMNYMWMPYNTTIPAADFTGKYKVMWNKTTNLLYFLVEITDDKFVNGYIYSKSAGGYPNFDVVEVFIDEDRPGGDHAMTNAAFAYHITGGNSTTDFDAIDIYDPTNSYNWAAGIYVNYKSHLPEFKRTNVGTNYTWEFSLMVLKSNYLPVNEPSSFKATLVDGKKMGLTLAYCDNDNSAVNPKRDNFIASKYQTQANSDISWQNSTNFAHLTLKETGANALNTTTYSSVNFSLSSAKILSFSINQSWSKPTLTISDIYGRIVLKSQASDNRNFDLKYFKSGCYIVVIDDNTRKITRKILL